MMQTSPILDSEILATLWIENWVWKNFSKIQFYEHVSNFFCICTCRKQHVGTSNFDSPGGVRSVRDHLRHHSLLRIAVVRGRPIITRGGRPPHTGSRAPSTQRYVHTHPKPPLAR